MRKIICVLAFAFLFFSRFPGLGAQENFIVAVRISGLTRTKPQVAEAALEKFIGRPAADIDLNEVRAAILDTGILEPLELEIVDAPGKNGKIIQAELRDKWSIFPVPVFFIGSSGFQAGAAFYDANAFGLNHKAAIMGMYQSEGWMVYGMYIKPPKPNPGWGAMGAFSQSDRTDQDQKEVTIRRFSQDSLDATGLLNFQLTDILRGSLRLGYAARMIRQSDDWLRRPDADAHGLRMGAELSARKSSWDGYFLSEKGASFGYTYLLGLNSPSFHSLSLDGTLQQSLVPGFRADLRTGLLYSPDAEPLFESGPSSARVQILPRHFSAQHYAGFSLGLEKHIYKFSFGVLSILGAWQGVYSYGPILESQFDQGLSASLSLYLSKLAIPALGAGVVYNITRNHFLFSFSMGMSL
ncbi:MAG: hypothetical protein LBT39_07820 [Treponema sp.]|jgi:outer membrane protein assembly factor BamA|nr:hypothetical protein [Treponema sp.]